MMQSFDSNMNTSLKIGLTAIVLFVISHFLRAYDTLRGYACFQECWKMMREHDVTNLGGWLYYSGFVLSNVVFLVLGSALFVTRRGRPFRLVASLIILLHTISWLFVNISGAISEIKVGYYLWLTAYVLLFAAHLTKKANKSLEPTAGAAVAQL